MVLYTSKTNEKQSYDFGQKLFEKIDGGFLSDDFFEKVLKSISRNENNGESPTLFEMIRDFAHECYIHGVDIGMETAAEIFKQSNK